MDKGDMFLIGWITGIIVLFIIRIIIESTNPTPTAMDVYQGKTTLEITYKDGVPVDSIVVFK